jgi:threonine/homoserine/homoserine lactone efflux protein
MPLGVVNVAIADAALAREKRFALGLAIGGAVADGGQAAIAWLGLASVITARPTLEKGLALSCGIAILVFAITSWRRNRVRKEHTYEHPTVLRGVGSGLAITLPNPAAFAAWLAVATAVPAGSMTTAIACAVGAGLGSAAWFIVLGKLLGRVNREHRIVSILPKAAIVVFVAIAVLGIIRVFAK